ncbi:MAG: glycosyltransferase [Thiohalomonadales bacterium]
MYDFAMSLQQHLAVTVLAPALNSSTEKNGQLTIVRFAVPSLPLSLLSPVKPTNWLKIIRTLQAGKSAAHSLAQQHKFDHCFSLWVLPSGYWARSLKKQHGIPYSIWALGSDIWSLKRIPIVKQILIKTINDSSHCFADGYGLAQDASEISKKPFHFLPSSRQLHPTEIKKPSYQAPYKLAFLGRWHLNKGIDILMECLLSLTSDDWTKIIEVRIFGGGPLEPQLRNIHDKLLRLNRPVQLGGFIDKQAATNLYQWADYLIIPSRIESIPVVYSDAMQTRCPVIATPVGDLPRLITEFNTGIVAENVSVSALRDAIRQSLAASPKRFRAGIEKAAECFDNQKIAQQFLSHIDIDTT